jgi:hypothetical protein
MRRLRLGPSNLPMVSAMAVQDQPGPPVDGGEGRQPRDILCADPDERVVPVLSREMPRRSMRPAIRKAARFGAMAVGCVLAVILLSFMVEAN